MSKRRTYEFLQLTNTIPYPPTKKAQLSIVHSNLIEYVINNFDGTRYMKEKIIHVLNCITYMYVSGDSLPSNWNVNDPFHTFKDYPDDILETRIATCYIHPKDVDWVDVPVKSISVDASLTSISDESSAVSTPAETNYTTRHVPKSAPISASDIGLPQVLHTPKSDLYIQPPTVPRFNISEPYAAGVVEDTQLVVYKSVPEVPTKQNEISATTDVNMMTDKDLLKLFPTRFIRTRAECMYTSFEGLTLDNELGLILPVEGYTDKQLRDNIIRYPHIFKLMKVIDDRLESFYSTIEIDGELQPIAEIWRRLPESLCIPYSKEFIKEYVVRRYLLERDIKGIQHRYKLYGELDPFLTLFTTVEDYARLGYTDSVKLARDCVSARVRYKQSRNPVLRRLSNNA